VHVDETGKIKVSLKHHRKMAISLDREDAEKLVDKLNQLIPKAKNREIRAHIMRERARHSERRSKGSRPSSYVTMPYYFPTEQVDIVNKLRSTKKRKKK